MSYRARLGLLLAALAALWPLAVGAAGGAGGDRHALDRLRAQAPKTKLTPNFLSLEVTALRSLRTWQATPAQMKALLGLLKPDFVKKTKREPAKVSDKLVKNMGLLRDALVQDEEEDIRALSDKVDVLLDEDEVLDDKVEISPAAAGPAREALRLFTPRQVLAFLKSFEDDLPDPPTVLLDALDAGTDAKPDKWEEVREEAVAQVVWLLGGLALKQPEKLAAEVRKWLDGHHKIKAEDLTKQRARLEEEINKEFTSRISPNGMLFNITWHGMAELLCNPRLKAALEERLKAAAAPTK
jgi:hypothetical protein